MSGWHFIPCDIPGCGKQHPTYTHPSKRGPARAYSGPYVSPLRPAPQKASDDFVSPGVAGEDARASSEASARALRLPGPRQSRPPTAVEG